MSAKTTSQPGRRTPLSLSGAVTKIQPNKGSNTAVNGGGINANGHPVPSNGKQDNKLQQQKSDQPTVSNLEAKENPNKKQQSQIEKKTLQNENKKSNEKIQNGAGSSTKQETNENKQQQQNKEKAHQQSGNDETKVIAKEKPDKPEKSKDKPEKDFTKSKEDKKREQPVPQSKKEEKKTKELKDTKEDKLEVSSKSDEITEMQQQIKSDNKSKDEGKDKSIDKKSEKMDIVEDHITPKSSNSATPKSNSKINKTSTPVNKTPTRIGEKTPQKVTPANTIKISLYKREETTTIDDNDFQMEPLAIEISPVKPPHSEQAANIKTVPSATSTPGKSLLSKRGSDVPKSDVQLAMQTELSLDRPRMFSQISGRKSIRPISDYTPSKFQSNLQFRESYRRINTELDVTNTSMNVTVGSEAASNFSFSFFGRGRKRDRTSPTQHSQSAIGELQTDIESSPPKKARLDIHGLLSAVSSPITLLRNRFSKASLQSSTPVKLQDKLELAEDEIEVQNVSGVSMHEEIITPDKEPKERNLTIDETNATLGEEAKEAKLTTSTALSSPEGKEFKGVSCGIEESHDHSVVAVEDQMSKNKRCAVM